MLALIATVLFFLNLFFHQHATAACARGWVSKKPINLTTKVSCSKLEQVKISDRDNAFEICQASCLEDDNCIGLQTSNPWRSCYKVSNEHIWECERGPSFFYPKVCGTCTVQNIANLDPNAVPNGCDMSPNGTSLTLSAGSGCTLACAPGYSTSGGLLECRGGNRALQQHNTSLRGGIACKRRTCSVDHIRKRFHPKSLPGNCRAIWSGNGSLSAGDPLT